ncbi:hypothetical protein ACF0H5_021726 [Mactra antiquata]
MSLFGKSLILCVLIIAVSASVSEKLLKIPLLEVGEIWVKSVYKLNANLLNYVWNFVDFYSPTFYIGLAVLGFLSYHFYGLVFRPINRVRVLGDLGYLPDGKFSMKEIANNVKQRRAVGDIPPVYPNGWFGLIESWRLKNGESTNLSMLGQQFAVFRDDKGEAHVLDAYCPHMGANLAVGGRVVGDCIECPFHGWKFRGHDGKCTDIPYTDKVPEFAKVKSWTSLELNGWIYVWHHAEGIEPNWTPLELEEITAGTWQYKGRTEHFINAHIEEIPENGADVAHLKQVHEPFIAAGIDLAGMWNKYLSFGQHRWTAQWTQMPKPDEHIGSLKLTHDLTFFGISLPFVFLRVHAMQIGPAIVYLTFESFFGKGVFIQSLIPVEPMVQKLTHNIYIHWTVPNFIAKFFMFGEAIQVERDVMIWNNKKYEAKPMFTKSPEDSLISRHRRWYGQFYSENSPRMTFKKKDTLDW